MTPDPFVSPLRLTGSLHRAFEMGDPFCFSPTISRGAGQTSARLDLQMGSDGTAIYNRPGIPCFAF